MKAALLWTLNYAVMISFLHSSGEMLPSDEDNEVAAVSETCNGFAVHALPQWMSAKGVIASPKS